ncbi:hypothetical protein ABID22_001987 [Pontibacter aydingkolensis]
MFAHVILVFSACDRYKEIEHVAVVHKEINASIEYTSPLQVNMNNDGENDLIFNNVPVPDSRGAHKLIFKGRMSTFRSY